MDRLLQETQKKAGEGDAAAMIRLSCWHHSGEQGLDPDRIKSYEWASKAALAGNTEAQCMVALKLEGGDGVKRDMVKAFEMYRKAYEGGDARACYQLATFFEGAKGMEAHLPTAIAYYEEGAKRGCGASQYQLAFRCLTGNGVERNPGRALSLLEESGRNGVPSAFDMLGRLYLEGRDAPRDPGKAFDFFTRALEFFDVDYAISIGDCPIYYALCLLTGTGCVENRKLGMEVLQVAADAENPVAREVLSERVIRNPQIQSSFGFNAAEAYRKTGKADWDISHLF
ncbi:MAG: sel1 repeat family protein [Alphaproteobacteria bacterium]|nr:MAG: sel1 repeat family protein [Alphaproteobacteria bacterium]